MIVHPVRSRVIAFGATHASFATVPAAQRKAAAAGCDEHTEPGHAEQCINVKDQIVGIRCLG